MTHSFLVRLWRYKWRLSSQGGRKMWMATPDLTFWWFFDLWSYGAAHIFSLKTFFRRRGNSPHLEPGYGGHSRRLQPWRNFLVIPNIGILLVSRANCLFTSSSGPWIFPFLGARRWTLWQRTAMQAVSLSAVLKFRGCGKYFLIIRSLHLISGVTSICCILSATTYASWRGPRNRAFLLIFERFIYSEPNLLKTYWANCGYVLWLGSGGCLQNPKKLGVMDVVD